MKNKFLLKNAILATAITGTLAPIFFISSKCDNNEFKQQVKSIELKLTNFQNEFSKLKKLNVLKFKDTPEITNLLNQISSFSKKLKKAKNMEQINDDFISLKDNLDRFNKDDYLELFNRYDVLKNLPSRLKTSIDDLCQEMENRGEKELVKLITDRFTDLKNAINTPNEKYTIAEKVAFLEFKKISLEVMANKANKKMEPARQAAIKQLKELIASTLVIVEKWTTIDLDPNEHIGEDIDDYEKSLFRKIEKFLYNLDLETFSEINRRLETFKTIAENIKGINEANIDKLLEEMQNYCESIVYFNHNVSSNQEIQAELKKLITQEEMTLVNSTFDLYGEILKKILNSTKEEIQTIKTQIEERNNKLKPILEKLEKKLRELELQAAIKVAETDWLVYTNPKDEKAGGYINMTKLKELVEKAKDTNQLNSLKPEEYIKLTHDIENTIDKCSQHLILRQEITTYLDQSRKIVTELRVVQLNDEATKLETSITENSFQNDENLTNEMLVEKQKAIIKAKDDATVVLYKKKFEIKFTEGKQIVEQLKAKNKLDEAEALNEKIKEFEQKLIDGEFGINDYEGKYNDFVQIIENFKKLIQ
ncbi:hypothetical protein ACJA25_02790 [Mycoplasmopsis hyopharyngis]|uniref:hypothetical protein n=1 Tax=Mycoplasmopsis hyopharyngis TaxID=29558 RepID=UPI003872C4EB